MAEKIIVTFESAEELVEFARRHNATEVFKSHKLYDPEHYSRTFGSKDKQREHFQIQIPVQHLGRLMLGIFDIRPEAPTGWTHVYGRHIAAEYSQKKDFAEKLRELKVNPDKVKMFNKITKTELREFTDASPTEDMTLEELISKKKTSRLEDIDLKVEHPMFSEVRASVVASESYKNNFTYRLMADFSRHWESREAHVLSVLRKTDWPVYTVKFD